MGFILFLIVVIFITLIILVIHLSSKQNNSYHYPSDAPLEGDLLEGDPCDLFDDDPYEEDSFHSSPSASSSFPYPDPYNLLPEKSMFLGEDGEILDDL